VLERAKDLLELAAGALWTLMILIMIFYPRGFAGILETLKNWAGRIFSAGHKKGNKEPPEDAGNGEK
jgi:hypothetical protein